jgi:hypothetical protein
VLVKCAEFARLMKVSRKSVSVWKNDDRLVMIDDRVDVAASRAKLEKYSSSGSKAYSGARGMAPQSNEATPVGNAPPVPSSPAWPGVPPR